MLKLNDGTITSIDPTTGLIWYMYKGDEIAWDGGAYISALTGTRFDSLHTMDVFWENYFKPVFEVTYPQKLDAQ